MTAIATEQRRAPALWKLGVAAAVILVAVLLSGLLPLIQILGVPVTGVVETGQADPMRWWVSVPAGLVAMAFAVRRAASAERLVWQALLVSAMVLAIVVFCSVASERPLLSAMQAVPRNEGRSLNVGVVTALPLFWVPGKSIADQIATEQFGEGQALLRASRHHLRAVDSLAPAALETVDRLLLLQPHLLAPTELVALDAWVRMGGKVVILTDPLLLWPSELPLGDPRAPPVTSLLDPLLSHWGVRLEAAGYGREQVERRRLASGHVLILAGASRYTGVGPPVIAQRCRIEDGGLTAACRIGRGQVRLIADADMVDDHLWLVERARVGDSAAYGADTVAVLDHWIDAPLAALPRNGINRVASEETLIAATRWGLLVGIGWVSLGTMLMAARNRRVLARKGRKGN